MNSKFTIHHDMELAGIAMLHLATIKQMSDKIKIPFSTLVDHYSHHLSSSIDEVEAVIDREAEESKPNLVVLPGGLDAPS